MPNWVSSVINVTGDSVSVEKLVKLIKSTESVFDFNKVIRMPKKIRIAGSCITKSAMRLVELEANKILLRKNKTEYTSIVNYFKDGPLSKNLSYLHDMASSPKTVEDARYLGCIALSNEKKYGFADWYGWRNKNWGTKWNTYETAISQNEEGKLEIKFQTAWKFPKPIFIKLFKTFPLLTWSGYYSDEDVGGDNHGFWMSTVGHKLQSVDINKKDIIGKCWGENTYDEFFRDRNER